MRVRNPHEAFLEEKACTSMSDKLTARPEEQDNRRTLQHGTKGKGGDSDLVLSQVIGSNVPLQIVKRLYPVARLYLWSRRASTNSGCLRNQK